MANLGAPALALAAAPPPRPYKDILTVALHKRFVKATQVVFVACYAVAVIIGGRWSLFWSWFPLGPVLLRTLLLFICALMIFILRVAQMHIGSRTAPSKLHEIVGVLLSRKSIQTPMWYLLSAFIFTETYMFWAPHSANLALKAITRQYERAQLNEQAIYLRSTFYILALLQSCVHLACDYDGIRAIPVPKSYLEAEGAAARLAAAPSPMRELRAALPRRLQMAFARCLVMTVAGPIVYGLFLRRRLWRWTLFAVKGVLRLSRPSPVPPGAMPVGVYMFARSLAAWMLLSFIWETVAVAFEAYFAQEPTTKGGAPLTETCRDANGTLLTGLASKRDVVKTFAFWELLYITRLLPARRRLIFEEIDRKDATTWKQILEASLAVLEALDARVATALKEASGGAQPNPAPADAAAAAEPTAAIQRLPRLARPPRREPVLAGEPAPNTRREKLQQSVGAFAKAHGQTPAPQGAHNPASPLALASRLLHLAAERALTPGQQQRVQPVLDHPLAALQAATLGPAVRARLRQHALWVVRQPFGAPFRLTLRRRAAAVVCVGVDGGGGGDGGDVGVVVDAASAVAELAAHSVAQDPFGKVAGDVPRLVRVYVRCLANLRRLEREALAVPHWTDVEADERRQRWQQQQQQRGARVPPAAAADDDDDLHVVHTVQHALAHGLEELLLAFGRYADELGLSAKELRAAKRAAGIPEHGDGDDDNANHAYGNDNAAGAVAARRAAAAVRPGGAAAATAAAARRTAGGRANGSAVTAGGEWDGGVGGGVGAFAPIRRAGGREPRAPAPAPASAPAPAPAPAPFRSRRAMVEDVDDEADEVFEEEKEDEEEEDERQPAYWAAAAAAATAPPEMEQVAAAEVETEEARRRRIREGKRRAV